MKPVLFVAVLGVVVSCGGSKEVATEPPDPPITCISIGPTVSPASATLLLGDSLQLTVMPNLCRNPSASSFTWRSSNPAIASVVRETGVVHALSTGVVTITTVATADTTIRGAAVVAVTSGAQIGLVITIKSVTYVSNGKPANLDSLAGVVEVDAVADAATSAAQIAELVVSKAGSDTVVATSTSPAPAPAGYTHALRWNTDARDASGSRIFPNAQTVFRVRFHQSGSAMVENTTSTQGTLRNP